MLALTLIYGAVIAAATWLLLFTGLAESFQGPTDFQIWVCSATMLLGRLELLAVLVPCTPQFWRK